MCFVQGYGVPHCIFARCVACMHWFVWWRTHASLVHRLPLSVIQVESHAAPRFAIHGVPDGVDRCTIDEELADAGDAAVAQLDLVRVGALREDPADLTDVDILPLRLLEHPDVLHLTVPAHGELACGMLAVRARNEWALQIQGGGRWGHGGHRPVWAHCLGALPD